MLHLYELDDEIVVCEKPAGAASQDDGTQTCAPALLRGQCGGEIYPVHRLDTGTAGLMVFARTRQAAAALSGQIADGGFQKEYLCAVHGIPPQPEGEWEDLLFRDSRKNKSYVVKRERKGVRRAKLAYTLVSAAGEGKNAVSVLRIRLFTGRTHQIRVQCASRGLPLLGDGKYGAADNRKALALRCCRLRFLHPATGEEKVFSSEEADRRFCASVRPDAAPAEEPASI